MRSFRRLQGTFLLGMFRPSKIPQEFSEEEWAGTEW